MENNKMYEDFIKASQEFTKPSFSNTVSYGATHFKYADLAEILGAIRDPLLKHGFVITHSMTYVENIEYLTTSIIYKNGEVFKESAYPIDINNQKMQDVGKQITYIKRYHISSLCCICAEEDNDAVEIKDQKLNETIDADQQKHISSLLAQLPTGVEAVILKWCNVKKLKDIPKAKFTAIVTDLNKKILKGENKC